MPPRKKPEDLLKRGRPTKYSEAVALKLCELISHSDKGLHRICADEDDMPSAKVVYEWLDKDPNFRERYRKAKEQQADFLVDQIVEISNTVQLGTRTTTKAWGDEITEADMTEHRKLQIDARKWVTARLAPKKYGDRVDVTTGGEKISTTVITWGDKKIEV